MALAIIAIFGLAIPFLLDHQPGWWPWVLALVFFLLALIRPTLLAGIYTVWMAFGSVMSRVNSFLILGLVFFMMVTPLGLLLRLFGNDPLQLKPDESESLFSSSTPRPPSHMKNPF